MSEMNRTMPKKRAHNSAASDTMAGNKEMEMSPLVVGSDADDLERNELAPPNEPGPAGLAAQAKSDFAAQALKFLFCFAGLQVSYLTWGYMQELIMTTRFEPTPRVPDGKFPSAAFCVFSNRFLAIIVATIAVRIRHGALLQNNVAPLVAFAPCALSNTLSSWSQYASLRYVSFPVQTVFKSSKIIPVMIMGKVLKVSDCDCFVTPAATARHRQSCLILSQRPLIPGALLRVPAIRSVNTSRRYSSPSVWPYLASPAKAPTKTPPRKW